MAYGYYEDPGNTYGNTGETNTGETYIQRQQRLQQQSQTASQPKTTTTTPSSGSSSAPQQTSQPAAGSIATPVMGNGSIPPPAPAPPAPAAAPAPAPAPAPQVPSYNGGPQPPAGQTDPFGGNGVWYGSGWAPKDHPLAIEAVANFGKQNAASATAPASAPVGAPGSATGGAAEASKGVFTQYAAPQHDFQNWQQLQLVSDLLANPQTMTADVLAKQKQASIEEALSMQQQLQQQAAEQAAVSGFAQNGGRVAAQNRATNEAIMNAILSQNREHEIAAAQQNRQDQLAALGVAESILGGQVGRSGNVFQNILSGQQANRDDLYRGRQLDLQKELGVGGLNIDQQRVSNQNRQFDASHGLNILQFLEGQRQHNNSMGFNWAGLNQQGQNNLIQNVLRTIG